MLNFGHEGAEQERHIYTCRSVPFGFSCLPGSGARRTTAQGCRGFVARGRFLSSGSGASDEARPPPSREERAPPPHTRPRVHKCTRLRCLTNRINMAEAFRRELLAMREPWLLISPKVFHGRRKRFSPRKVHASREAQTFDTLGGRPRAGASAEGASRPAPEGPADSVDPPPRGWRHGRRVADLQRLPQPRSPGSQKPPESGGNPVSCLGPGTGASAPP